MATAIRPVAERRRPAPAIDETRFRARVSEVLSRRPAVGFAAGVVWNGRLQLFDGRGLADVASSTPVTADTVFRVGSITKTFTAVAVLQLVERGLVDLDGPANDYLRAYRLVPTKPGFRPATLRHLLTHTAGIPEVRSPRDALRTLFGETIRPGELLPSLAEYYGGALPIVADPGSRYVYTDHDFATLGQIVTDVTKVPFDAYLRERVFQPLGMTDTDVVRSERIRSRLARGYEIGAHGATEVADYKIVTVAGGAAYSTPNDIGRYLAALLGGGANDHGSVLEPASVEKLFQPQYQPDPRIPGLGLAFSRTTVGGHFAVEHGGIVPGVTSQIFLAPDDGVGAMAFTNGARDAMFWLPAQVAGLLGQVLGAAPEQAIRTDVPHHPEIWTELRGWYPLDAQLTDARARMAIGAGVEVSLRGTGPVLRIMSPIPAMSKGFALHPDDPADPYVFRIDLSELGVGTGLVVFTPAREGRSATVHLDLGMPLSLRKASALGNPRLWAAAGLGAIAVAASARGVRRALSRQADSRSRRAKRRAPVPARSRM